MAKETMIIFVYDKNMVQSEEDNPASAIMYFHPTWVSDQQKAALCGQITGTIQCVKSVLGKPKVVSLQTGKFFVIEQGYYLLAVGTDRNITNCLLKHRAEMLIDLISFFHKDFEFLAKLYTNESLSAKLYHMFETYLKMLVFEGNIFSHIPSLSLPKTASNIFLEAIHTLECCQGFDGVLGGCLLYHNKVVATQLSCELTKRLVLSDPYRIKSPAELSEVVFDLPLGVQLLQVFISNKEYNELVESSARNKSIYQYLTNKSIKKNATKQQPVQDTPILSAMKRDQSLIFTAVPEEGPDHSPQSEKPAFVPAIKKMRPKFLNLKSLSVDLASDVKTQNVTKPAPTTPFWGQTSVCSTPMTELKRFVHQNPLSICRNDSEDVLSDSSVTECQTVLNKQAIVDSKLDLIDNSKIAASYVNVTSILEGRKYKSLTDLSETFVSFSKDYPRLLRNCSLDQSPKKSEQIENKFKTITDPTFPVFKQNGVVVSQIYYETYIKTNLELIKSEFKKPLKVNPFMNFDVCLQNCFKNDNYKINGGISAKKSCKNEPNLKKVASVDCNNKTSVPNLKNKEPNIKNVESSNFKNLALNLDSEPEKLTKLKLTKERRKSLTLPLKSFNSDQQESIDVQQNKRYSSGVQLTPLLSKLSVLAFEERSSGFGSKESTPCDFRGSTPTHANPFAKNKPGRDVKVKMADLELRSCILFVCGQQDIVLTMILQEECCRNDCSVRKLWEICTEQLGKFEKQLDYCMESQSGAAGHGSEPYSYLCLDANWATTKRGGPWGTNDVGVLNYLHRDFEKNKNLTEILMRGGDSIIYGNKCGPSEVFYHESANTNAGLPPPADPMGLVQLKAKRRLERDHAVILL